MLSAVGQRGEFARVAQWIRTSWDELQVHSADWFFRWREFQVPLDAGYTTFGINPQSAASLPKLAIGQMTLIRANGQATRLQHLHVDFFRERFGARQQQGATADGGFTTLAQSSFPTGGLSPAADRGYPSAFTILPDRRVRFDRALIEDSDLQGRYQVPTQSLAADADIPNMPEEYHNAILYRALVKYADFEEATGLRQTSRDHESHWLNAMRRDLLPQIKVGSAPLEGYQGGGGGRWWP